jgi:hypothetical protein
VPYVTDETRAALDAPAPPVKLVTVGAGERAFSWATRRCLTGREDLLQPAGLGVRLPTTTPAGRAGPPSAYAVERVGADARLDFIALEASGGGHVRAGGGNGRRRRRAARAPVEDAAAMGAALAESHRHGHPARRPAANWRRCGMAA